MYSRIRSLTDSLEQLGDQISISKMYSLTRFGRKILPQGLWHGHGHGEDSQEHEALHQTLFLTYDDGPNPCTTPYLLEHLREEGIQATFFLIGNNVARHPELVQEMVRDGHTIGNHGYYHLFMPALPVKLLEKEIDDTNLRIKECVGFEPKLFRPPYGIINQKSADCLKERGMMPVYWGAVPEDWNAIGQKSVVKRVLKQIRPGSLIVLHEMNEIAPQTIDATRFLIKRLKGKGYQFKAVKRRPLIA